MQAEESLQMHNRYTPLGKDPDESRYNGGCYRIEVTPVGDCLNCNFGALVYLDKPWMDGGKVNGRRVGMAIC
jgi:hypothetical protein